MGLGTRSPLSGMTRPSMPGVGLGGLVIGPPQRLTADMFGGKQNAQTATQTNDLQPRNQKKTWTGGMGGTAPISQPDKSNYYAYTQYQDRQRSRWQR